MELKKAKENVKEAETKLATKQDEFDRANMDLVNLLLVEHKLTIQDLPELLSELSSENKNAAVSSQQDTYLN